MDPNNSFPNIEDEVPTGCKWVNGRPQKKTKNATRLDTSWPEEWPRPPKKQQQKIAAWDDERIRLQEARRKSGIFDVSSEDTEFLKVISEDRAKFEKCVVPSVPCIPKEDFSKETRRCADFQILGRCADFQILGAT